MQPLRLAGGHRAPAGTYEEVHSGHRVHLHHIGVLPGSANSDRYVMIGEPPQFCREEQEGAHLPSIKNEQD